VPLRGIRDHIVLRFETFTFEFNAFNSQGRMQGECGVDSLDRFLENPNAIPHSHQIHLGGGSPYTLGYHLLAEILFTTSRSEDRRLQPPRGATCHASHPQGSYSDDIGPSQTCQALLKGQLS
jgi:hypothetical protein